MISINHFILASFIIVYCLGTSACNVVDGKSDPEEKKSQFTIKGRHSRSKDLGKSADAYKEGDIIFQVSRSTQSKAIQAATGSRYSHCGILFKGAKGSWQVLEAENGVEITDLDKWKRRGDNHGHFVVKRYLGLSETALGKMKEKGRKHIGKRYDKKFLWSDHELYCSELVWKIYKDGADVQLGDPQYIKDLPVTSEGKKILESNLKKPIKDHTDPVISPARIFSSVLLTTVDSVAIQ